MSTTPQPNTSNIIYNPVQVSYITRNSANVGLSIIILIGFVFYSIKLSANIFHGTHKSGNVQYFDITNAMFYSISDILTNIAKSMRETAPINDDKNLFVGKSYGEKYEELLKKKQTSESTFFSQQLQSTNGAGSSDDNTFNKISGTLSSLTTITSKLNILQDANIKAMETLYTGYQTQIQKYVTNLINMLNTINRQITKLSIDKVYEPLISPLTKIFTSIKNTLVTNSSLIKQIYTGFDPKNGKTKIPDLIVPNSNILPNTNSAPNLFTLSGYS